MNRSVRFLVGAVCLSLFVMMVGASAGLAQDKGVRTTTGSVPVPVLDSFQDAYPEAEITGMSRLTEGGKVHFEIKGVDGGLSLRVLYVADGTFVAVEQGVAEEDLPEPVATAIADRYPGSKIIKALCNSRDGDTNYLLRIYTGGRRVNLVLNPDGTFRGPNAGGKPGSETE